MRRARWEDDERVVDLPFVLRKIEHRMGIAPYTPKLVELAVILSAVRIVVMKSDDDVLLFHELHKLHELRRSPTLSRAIMATLLGVLHESVEQMDGLR